MSKINWFGKDDDSNEELNDEELNDEELDYELENVNYFEDTFKSIYKKALEVFNKNLEDFHDGKLPIGKRFGNLMEIIAGSFSCAYGFSMIMYLDNPDQMESDIESFLDSFSESLSNDPTNSETYDILNTALRLKINLYQDMIDTNKLIKDEDEDFDYEESDCPINMFEILKLTNAVADKWSEIMAEGYESWSARFSEALIKGYLGCACSFFYDEQLYILTEVIDEGDTDKIKEDVRMLKEALERMIEEDENEED